MHASRLLAGGVLLAAMACSSPPPDPLQLNRNILTVENQSDEEWRNVEIWVNNYYRALTPSIQAHGRFQVQLDSFISGYGRRFEFGRAQVTDLRLSARRPGGEVVELRKDFQGSLLNEALGGK